MIKDISSIAHSFQELNTIKHSFMKLPQALYESLIKLESDNLFIITRPDKGCGTVVTNKKDYLSKVEYILSGTPKFKLIII